MHSVKFQANNLAALCVVFAHLSKKIKIFETQWYQTNILGEHEPSVPTKVFAMKHAKQVQTVSCYHTIVREDFI